MTDYIEPNQKVIGVWFKIQVNIVKTLTRKFISEEHCKSVEKDSVQNKLSVARPPKPGTPDINTN